MVYVCTYINMYISVPRVKKWPFSALRENFCSRITFSRRARRKVLFVPHSEPPIFPPTSKFPRAKPSAISRFSGKTSFLNSGTKLLFHPPVLAFLLFAFGLLPTTSNNNNKQQLPTTTTNNNFFAPYTI